jgi:hypothetical protein
VVLKLPVLFVNVIGFEHAPPAPPPLLKVAVTERDTVIDTVQVPVPLQGPLQPANVEPLAAAAVNVTDAPLE